jgi:hypothetical protein
LTRNPKLTSAWDGVGDAMTDGCVIRRVHKVKMISTKTNLAFDFRAAYLRSDLERDGWHATCGLRPLAGGSHVQAFLHLRCPMGFEMADMVDFEVGSPLPTEVWRGWLDEVVVDLMGCYVDGSAPHPSSRPPRKVPFCP